MLLRTALISVVFLSSFGFASAEEPMTTSAPITFSDGAVAVSYDHCGEGDLCATIKLREAEGLAIYSEGAAKCQAYVLEFVRTSQNRTLFTYQSLLNHEAGRATLGSAITGQGSCGNTIPTQYTFDHGLIHLTVVELTDGTLRMWFTNAGGKR